MQKFLRGAAAMLLVGAASFVGAAEPTVTAELPAALRAAGVDARQIVPTSEAKAVRGAGYFPSFLGANGSGFSPTFLTQRESGMFPSFLAAKPDGGYFPSFLSAGTSGGFSPTFLQSSGQGFFPSFLQSK